MGGSNATIDITMFIVLIQNAPFTASLPFAFLSSSLKNKLQGKALHLIDTGSIVGMLLVDGAMAARNTVQDSVTVFDEWHAFDFIYLITCIKKRNKPRNFIWKNGSRALDSERGS